ncbi:hypothetical protein LOC54_04025 [Acetobacter sp. AN02]|uniref:hypothetical protein n=1 Tax=Acetobacter sp. AN02 TaxID=2894186 RepID=UPI0024346546|nr:hypothetical protein [Acetobacter sp. AN02]MDG6094284.1 hypothetical protein [Acetobacter sp. AN02]
MTRVPHLLPAVLLAAGAPVLAGAAFSATMPQPAAAHETAVHPVVAVPDAPSAAPGLTDADGIVFRLSSASLGPGYSWGQGVLHYKGTDYAVSVSGGGAPAVGYSTICARGTVQDLPSVTHIDSTFWAVDAEATAGSGVGVMAMQNAEGAELHLSLTSNGVRLAAEAARLRFRLLGKSPKSFASFPCH